MGSSRGHHAGERLDAGDVEVRQLLHEFEDGVEFFLEMAEFLLAHRDAREMSHPADSRLIDGHDALPKAARRYSKGVAAVEGFAGQGRGTAPSGIAGAGHSIEHQ